MKLIAVLPFLLLAGVARADGELPPDLDRVSAVLARDPPRCTPPMPLEERRVRVGRAFAKACISQREHEALLFRHAYVFCDFEQERRVDRLMAICP